MKQEQIDMLDKERKEGKRAETAMKFLTPLFEHLNKRYAEAFFDCHVADIEVLQTIKLQQNAMESIQNHIQEYIDTGKIADIQLNNPKL